jgi:hypothetical protein
MYKRRACSPYRQQGTGCKPAPAGSLLLFNYVLLDKALLHDLNYFKAINNKKEPTKYFKQYIQLANIYFKSADIRRSASLPLLKKR